MGHNPTVILSQSCDDYIKLLSKEAKGKDLQPVKPA